MLYGGLGNRRYVKRMWRFRRLWKHRICCRRRRWGRRGRRCWRCGKLAQGLQMRLVGVNIFDALLVYDQPTQLGQPVRGGNGRPSLPPFQRHRQCFA
jgi:hypothetical protein